MTAEAPPVEASRMFGDRLPLACRYADLLCTLGVDRGLIGPREPARIWPRHLLNSAQLAGFVPHGAQVIDVGAGAGLPGIPLLLARPDLSMTLVEPMLRRATFLMEVREALGLAELEVVRARAEDVAAGCADVVVVRAVAPLPRLLAMTLPLLRSGGTLLAMKGSAATREVDEASDALLAAGASATVHLLGVGEDRTAVVQVRRHAGGTASSVVGTAGRGTGGQR
jgi:16S rRNA (guanine527-N7)-methyltransferase